MYDFRLKIITTAFCCMVLLYAPFTFADVKVGFVDMQTIIEKSSAYKDISAQIDSKAELFKANATKVQEKLQKQYQELEAKKSVISKEAYNKEHKAFEAEAERSQESAYMERMNLERAYADSIKTLEDTISDIVKNKAKSMDLAAVFANSTVNLFSATVLYYKPELDITDSVLDELNKTLTSVKVEFNPKKVDGAKQSRNDGSTDTKNTSQPKVAN